MSSETTTDWMDAAHEAPNFAIREMPEGTYEAMMERYAQYRAAYGCEPTRSRFVSGVLILDPEGFVRLSDVVDHLYGVMGGGDAARELEHKFGGKDGNR